MKELSHRPFLVIDNLVRTLMMVGAILIAGLVIAHPISLALKIAAVALILGFLSFTLTLQFLVAIEMEDAENITVSERAKDARLAFPFLFGNFAYIVAGLSMGIYFILS